MADPVKNLTTSLEAFQSSAMRNSRSSIGLARAALGQLTNVPATWTGAALRRKSAANWQAPATFATPSLPPVPSPPEKVRRRFLCRNALIQNASQERAALFPMPVTGPSESSRHFQPVGPDTDAGEMSLAQLWDKLSAYLEGRLNQSLESFATQLQAIADGMNDFLACAKENKTGSVTLGELLQKAALGDLLQKSEEVRVRNFRK